MPRGVPTAGFRKTRRYLERQGVVPAQTKTAEIIQFTAPAQTETTEQIAERLKDRFDILDILAQSCIVGDSRSLIVSGPAGLGKSFTVEKALQEWDVDGERHVIIKGYVRATGLFKMLYKHREAGHVIVMDDADSIFYDDVSLNILKAVCDTTEQRKVSWLTEARLNDDDTGDVIPRSFDFDGSIIFLTNIDFDAMIARGHKLSPHLQALVSRSQYVDLSMKSVKDYLVRIDQVVGEGMLDDLSGRERQDVMDFIHDNAASLRELSLRMAIKVAAIRKTNMNWYKIAKVTCCK
jgi:hypothetical protein